MEKFIRYLTSYIETFVPIPIARLADEDHIWPSLRPDYYPEAVLVERPDAIHVIVGFVIQSLVDQGIRRHLITLLVAVLFMLCVTAQDGVCTVTKKMVAQTIRWVLHKYDRIYPS
jgi:hypothetical protein